MTVCMAVLVCCVCASCLLIWVFWSISHTTPNFLPLCRLFFIPDLFFCLTPKPLPIPLSLASPFLSISFPPLFTLSMSLYVFLSFSFFISQQVKSLTADRDASRAELAKLKEDNRTSIERDRVAAEKMKALQVRSTVGRERERERGRESIEREGEKRETKERDA